TFAPVPGVLLDRDALAEVLVGGACFDGLWTAAGYGVGAGVYAPSNPRIEPWWAPEPSPEVRALLGLDRAPPQAVTEPAPALAAHRCGEPAVPPVDPATPRGEVTLRGLPGERVWIDGADAAAVPVTVSLEVGVVHRAVTAGGSRTFTVSETTPTELCLADEPGGCGA
ncbi:MAG: hypothetical protein ABMB14_34445, partial [Myxococcota bacterium]